MTEPQDDPNLHWDGSQWLRWDGTQWQPMQQPAARSRTWIIVAGATGAGLVLLVLMVLAAAVVTTAPQPTARPTPSATSSDPTPSEVPLPQPTTSTDRSAVLRQQLEAGYGPGGTKGVCERNQTKTHWTCFLESWELTGTTLRVQLLTDGGWSNADLDEMAETAGLHIFNFIGTDNPDIDTIVIYINGVDHGTTYRRNVPLLNR